MLSIRDRFATTLLDSVYLVAGAEVYGYSENSGQVSVLRARKCP